MHRLLIQINSKEVQIRRNCPKVTQKLWKTLEYRDFQTNRKQFVEKLFVDNLSQFESETQLKTIIRNAFEDQMVVEESDSKSGYRLVPSVDRKQFLNQLNDWYCFECHSSSADQNLIGCKSCFRSFHESCLEDKMSSNRQPNDSTISCDNESTLRNAEIGSNDLEMDTICGTLSNIGLEEQSDNRSNAEPINEVLSPLDPMDFECQYCCRFKYPDINSRVEQLCGQQLNRLIELFLKKLEISLEDIDIYEEYLLESNLTELMFIFSPMDLNTIRIKALQLKNYHNFV